MKYNGGYDWFKTTSNNSDGCSSSNSDKYIDNAYDKSENDASGYDIVREK